MTEIPIDKEISLMEPPPKEVVLIEVSDDDDDEKELKHYRPGGPHVSLVKRQAPWKNHVNRRCISYRLDGKVWGANTIQTTPSSVQTLSAS